MKTTREKARRGAASTIGLEAIRFPTITIDCREKRLSLGDSNRPGCSLFRVEHDDVHTASHRHDFSAELNQTGGG